MPTLSASTVEGALEALRALLAAREPGEVIPYPDLVRALANALGLAVEGKDRKRFHLTRAAVDMLRAEGRLEPWGRQLRDGRWALTHVRLSGSKAVEPPAPPRRVHKRYQNRDPRFRVNPVLLATVEATLLALLREPHDPQELLFASAFTPPPAPGWIPYPWLTPRVAAQVGLTPATRYNVLGLAVRSLARKGLVELIAPSWKNGRRRVRWVRLATQTPSEVSSAPSS